MGPPKAQHGWQQKQWCHESCREYTPRSPASDCQIMRRNAKSSSLDHLADHVAADAPQQQHLPISTSLHSFLRRSIIRWRLAVCLTAPRLNSEAFGTATRGQIQPLGSSSSSFPGRMCSLPLPKHAERTGIIPRWIPFPHLVHVFPRRHRHKPTVKIG